MGNKYSIGDLVSVNKTGEIGSIEKVERISDDYYNYIVKIGDSERVYNEDYITIYRDTKDIKKISQIDFNKISYSIEVSDKIDSIIRKLNLEKSDDNNTQLKNACKLVEYLSLRNKNKKVELIDTSDLKLNELYIGLSDSDDSVANAYLFAEILKKVNMDVLCVIVEDKEDIIHVANLVWIDGFYYYFDLSIERSISNDRKTKNFVLCCSGIGRNNYEKFFKPLSILNIEDDEKIELPDNISKDDLDFYTLNSIYKKVDSGE